MYNLSRKQKYQIVAQKELEDIRFNKCKKNKTKREILYPNKTYMPFTLCNEMIRRVNVVNKKILVINNVEFVHELNEEFGVPYQNIVYFTTCKNEQKYLESSPVTTIEEFTKNMKFDVILGNPPYEGTKALHQQFFNKAVEVLNDGGELCFIQPDSAYTSKKSRQKKPNQEMMENIKKYKVSVKFVEGTVFEAAAVATSLSITHLTKVEDKQIAVEYINGDKYDHIDLEFINKLGVEPKLYASLKQKIEKYISKHGCLDDIAYRTHDNIQKHVFKISEVRGNVGSNDFYTFVSNEKSYHNYELSNIGLIISQDEENSIYSYLTTHIARYALSIYKTNTNQFRAFGIVPLVPFDRVWTDEMLAKEIDITDKELKEIRKIIPDYHKIL